MTLDQVNNVLVVPALLFKLTSKTVHSNKNRLRPFSVDLSEWMEPPADSESQS